MKITTTDKITTRRLSAIIYSPPGYGKTTLAGTLTGKTLVVSAESGLLSLHDKSIDVVEINSYTDLVEVTKFLGTKTKYENVFIDSLTEVSQKILENLKRKFPEAKDGLRLWGEYADLITACIKYFRDLSDYNVFFTALSKVDKDENNVRYSAIDISGKIAERLPGLFDLVMPLVMISGENGAQNRMLLTAAVDKYIAKDRSGKLDRLEPPNLQLILNKILGERTDGSITKH